MAKPKSPAESISPDEQAFHSFFNPELSSKLESAYRHKGVGDLKTFDQLQKFLVSNTSGIYEETGRIKQVGEFFNMLSKELESFIKTNLDNDKQKYKNIPDIDIAINSAKTAEDSQKVQNLQYLKRVPKIIERCRSLQEITEKLSEDVSKIQAYNQNTLKHVTRPSLYKKGAETPPSSDQARKPPKKP